MVIVYYGLAVITALVVTTLIIGEWFGLRAGQRVLRTAVTSTRSRARAALAGLPVAASLLCRLIRPSTMVLILAAWLLVPGLVAGGVALFAAGCGIIRPTSPPPWT